MSGETFIDVEKEYGIDVTTAEVLRNGFISVSRQMTNQLLRSCFSPVIRDFLDYTTAITSGVDLPDLNIDMIASGEGAALHYATGQFQIRNCVLEWGLENLEKGDVLIFNDPFRGGNHFNDVAVVKPVFYENEIVAFVFERCHWIDIGGMAVGSYSPGAATESVQEGLRLGPMLLFKKNRPMKSMFNLLADNSRMPFITYADLFAVVSGLNVAEVQLERYLKKYGPETVKKAMKYTLDHGERMMRGAIEEIPDGVYEYEDFLDDDGIEDKPIKIRLKIEIKGDCAEVDFSGTSRQALGNVNCPYAIAATAVYTAFQMVLDPLTPGNAGCWRPIDLLIPEGTVLNALPPAATSLGFEECYVVIDSVVAALSQAVGEKGGVAQSYGSPFCTVHSGVDPRGGLDVEERMWIAITTLWGGFGGNYLGDGDPFCSTGVINSIEISTEILEQDFPVISSYKEFSIDSAGAGKHRGGPALVWDLIPYVDYKLSDLSDRFRFPPKGILGGRDGQRGYYYLVDPLKWNAKEKGFIPTANGRTEQGLMREIFEPYVGMFNLETKELDYQNGTWLTGKFSDRPLRAWAMLRRVNSSAAGFGNPYDRNPELVLRDVRDEYVSLESARRDYGVIIEGDLKKPEQLRINYEETEKLRDRLQEGQG